MPDLHRIEGELLGFYSKPQYSSLFYQRNRFEMAAKTIHSPGPSEKPQQRHCSAANHFSTLSMSKNCV